MTEKLRLIIYINCLILFPLILFAQPAGIQTNEEIIAEQLCPPVMHTLDSLSMDSAKVKIKLEKKSDLGNWLIKKLQEQFIQKQVILYDTSAEVSGNLLVVNINYSVQNQSGKILFSGSINPEFRDVLSRSKLKTVESNHYSFTKGQKIDSKFFAYFFEPLLVTVTTVGVVYLFFSLRSGS
ncbi:MAG: hypothetical protein P8048_11570 [Calditrichia bacterium]